MLNRQHFIHAGLILQTFLFPIRAYPIHISDSSNDIRFHTLEGLNQVKMINPDSFVSRHRRFSGIPEEFISWESYNHSVIDEKGRDSVTPRAWNATVRIDSLLKRS